MAVKPQIKANQLAKDLNIKSKEIVDIMAQKGIELKAQKALEPHEFNVLFDALTSAHQIDGIDDYIDGITFIPSKLEKAEEKPEEPKAEESKKAEAAPVTVKPDDSKKADTVAAPAKKDAAEKVVPTPAKENVAAKTEAPVKKVQPKVDRAEAIARAAAIEKAAQEKARGRRYKIKVRCPQKARFQERGQSASEAQQFWKSERIRRRAKAAGTGRGSLLPYGNSQF